MNCMSVFISVCLVSVWKNIQHHQSSLWSHQHLCHWKQVIIKPVLLCWQADPRSRAVNDYLCCLLIIGWWSFEPTGEGLREADIADGRSFIVYFRLHLFPALFESTDLDWCYSYQLISELCRCLEALMMNRLWMHIWVTRALLCVSRMDVSMFGPCLFVFPSAQCVLMLEDIQDTSSLKQDDVTLSRFKDIIIIWRLQSGDW